MGINNIKCNNIKKEINLPALVKDEDGVHYFLIKDSNSYKLLNLKEGLICFYDSKIIKDLLDYYKCELISEDISLTYTPM